MSLSDRLLVMVELGLRNWLPYCTILELLMFKCVRHLLLVALEMLEMNWWLDKVRVLLIHVSRWWLILKLLVDLNELLDDIWILLINSLRVRLRLSINCLASVYIEILLLLIDLWYTLSQRLLVRTITKY